MTLRLVTQEEYRQMHGVPLPTRETVLRAALRTALDYLHTECLHPGPLSFCEVPVCERGNQALCHHDFQREEGDDLLFCQRCGGTYDDVRRADAAAYGLDLSWETKECEPHRVVGCMACRYGEGDPPKVEAKSADASPKP